MGFVNIPSTAAPTHINALSDALTDAHNTLSQNYVQKKLDAELIRQKLKDDQSTPGTDAYTALQKAAAEAKQEQHKWLMENDEGYKAKVKQEQATLKDQKSHADFIKLLAQTDMANSFVNSKSEEAFYGSGSGNSKWDKAIAQNNQENEANPERKAAKKEAATALNTYLIANPNSDSSEFYNTELGTELAKKIAKHTKKIDVVELNQEYRRGLEDYLRKNKEEAFRKTPDGQLLFANSTTDEKSKILYDTALAAYNYFDPNVNENSFKGTDEGKRLSENITKNAQVDSSQLHKAYDNFFYDGGENYKNWQAAIKAGDFNTAAKLVEIMQLDKATKEADRAATLVKLRENVRAAETVDAKSLIDAKKFLSDASKSSSSSSESSSKSEKYHNPDYVTAPEIIKAFTDKTFFGDGHKEPSLKEAQELMKAFYTYQGRPMSKAELSLVMSKSAKAGITSAIDAVSVPGVYKLDEPLSSEVVLKPTPQPKRSLKDILITADQARADLAAFKAESPEAILAGLKFRGDSIVEAKKVEAKKVEAKKVEAKKVEAKKVEAKKVEAKKVEAKKVEGNSSFVTHDKKISGPEKQAQKRIQHIEEIKKELKKPDLLPIVRRILERQLKELQQTQTK